MNWSIANGYAKNLTIDRVNVNGDYEPSKVPQLYDKLTAEEYDVNLIVKDSTIRSGTALILI